MDSSRSEAGKIVHPNGDCESSPIALNHHHQLPGLAFRASCYLAPSGEVYLADSVVVTYPKAGPLVQAAWIAASPQFARWATTP
jgi:hypothetical protein